MRKITIGFQLVPQWGEMKIMRRAWMDAEAAGADALYSCDHFFPQIITTDVVTNATASEFPDGANFEGTTVMAAMAATTTRPEIGCLVQANSYRNPNLTADIARTIDHISNGRFILGIGSGYAERDYLEYGYSFGTTKTRLLDLARDLPIIKARFDKLNPPAIRKIPILIASMGEKIGMRIVAEHADRWHVYGEIDKVLQKTEVLKQICKDIGRNFSEIELTSYYFPEFLEGRDADPTILSNAGITHIIAVTRGPTWDLLHLRELVDWRDSMNKAV